MAIDVIGLVPTFGYLYYLLEDNADSFFDDNFQAAHRHWLRILSSELFLFELKCRKDQ